MKRHWPLFAFFLFACLGATFGPVVFRSWVLQHDLDGGGHTINNVAIDATSLLLNGAAVGGGSDTVWTNDGTYIFPLDDSRLVRVGKSGEGGQAATEVSAG